MTDRMRITPAARAVARAWAGSRPIVPALLRDLAEQAQEHLDHGADPAFLELVAAWMAAAQPSWRDLSLAFTFPSAPRPLTPAVAPLRAGSGRTGGCPCCGPCAVRRAARRPAITRTRRNPHVTKRSA